MGGRSKRCFLTIKQFNNQLSLDVISAKGVLLATVSKSFTVLDNESNRLEYDPFEVVFTLRSLINSLYQEHSIKPAHIQSISVVTQEQFFLLWDKVTGNPLTPLIDRDCMRAKEERIFFIKSPTTETIQEKSCFSVVPQSPGLKLKGLVDNDPELTTQIERGNVKFGTLDSWLIYHLTGQNQHLTDISNAGKTQFYNPIERKWDPFLCEEWGATTAMMPKVLPSQANYGETSGFVPLQDGIPIVFVGIHQAATTLASYNWHIGAGFLHFGSESRLLIHIGNNINLLNMDTDQFVLFVQNNQVCFALDIVLTSWRLLFNCFGQKANGHVLDPELSYFKKELPLIVPFQKKNSRSGSLEQFFSIIGVYDGMSQDDKEASVLLSLVHLIKDTLDRYERVIGSRLKHLSLDGDLSQSMFFKQVLADMLQLGLQTYQKTMLSSLMPYFYALDLVALTEKQKRSAHFLQDLILPSLDPLSSFSRHQYWEQCV